METVVPGSKRNQALDIRLSRDMKLLVAVPELANFNDVMRGYKGSAIIMIGRDELRKLERGVDGVWPGKNVQAVLLMRHMKTDWLDAVKETARINGVTELKFAEHGGIIRDTLYAVMEQELAWSEEEHSNGTGSSADYDKEVVSRDTQPAGTSAGNGNMPQHDAATGNGHAPQSDGNNNTGRVIVVEHNPNENPASGRAEAGDADETEVHVDPLDLSPSGIPYIYENSMSIRSLVEKNYELAKGNTSHFYDWAVRKAFRRGSVMAEVHQYRKRHGISAEPAEVLQPNNQPLTPCKDWLQSLAILMQKTPGDFHEWLASAADLETVRNLEQQAARVPDLELQLAACRSERDDLATQVQALQSEKIESQKRISALQQENQKLQADSKRLSEQLFQFFETAERIKAARNGQ